MVAQAAREICDGETVFVGMRLPLIAFVVAKRTHAPNAIGIFELGVMRDAPSRELLYTMGDPPNVAGARWCTRTVNVMGWPTTASKSISGFSQRASIAISNSSFIRSITGASFTALRPW